MALYHLGEGRAVDKDGGKAGQYLDRTGRKQRLNYSDTQLILIYSLLTRKFSGKIYVGTYVHDTPPGFLLGYTENSQIIGKLNLPTFPDYASLTVFVIAIAIAITIIIIMTYYY